MDAFWVILIGAVVVGLLIGLGKNQAAQEAKKAYEDSLTALKFDPTNAGLRQATLELGRKYSNLTRNGKGVALFDEVALMNDLNAAAGGTMAIAQPLGLPVASRATASPSEGETVEDRLERLSRLKEKGLIDDAEYQEKRTSILGDL
ncbi:MAG TPA: SHOCT domain-containing protein [Thermoanaerobaculia bacterium]|nr:SHOCT domain-containing protein [Thermoanaerobaculia bacterium]